MTGPVGLPPGPERPHRAAPQGTVTERVTSIRSSHDGQPSALDRDLHVTIFPDLQAESCTNQYISLNVFAEQLRNTRAPTKTGLPLFSLCSFDRKRTSKNSLRFDGNVRECFAAVGDYDGEKTPLADAAEALRRAGLCGLLVTTSRYTPATPRWRVVVPFSDPLNRARPNAAGITLPEYPRLISRLAGVFPDTLAPESGVLSQSWYVGTVVGARDHGTLAIEDGDCIDRRPDLDATARPKPPPAKQKQRRRPAKRRDEHDAADTPELPLHVPDALAALGDEAPGIHDALVALCGRFAAEGLSQKTAEAIILHAFDQRPDAERDQRWHARRAEVRRTVAWAYERESETAIPGAGGIAPPPPSPPGSGIAGAAASPPNGPDLDLDASLPPAYTDEALALAFAEQHTDRLRHVAPWGQWLISTGPVWQQDDTLRVFSLTRLMLRQAAATCRKRRAATRMAAVRTVAAVEKLARADRRLAAGVAQWDRQSECINTPAGMLDLRTGQLRPHRAEDYCTKITAVAPDGDCPAWRKFLDRITGGDRELQTFLQRMAGYCLTGSTVEQVLFFLHGPGANGKGVFIGTLIGVMGSYAQTAAMTTFMAGATEQHSCDLAMLRGARLAVMQETDDGRRWAEARIKALTGDDAITARFMRENFFTYTPAFKIIVASNHRPRLRNVNEAVRRRLLLVPFTVVIPKPERDRYLSRRLKKEWPGILAWMVEGCREWQRIGLAPPAAVVGASENYLADEDLIGSWIEDCAKLTKGGTVYSATAYGSFRAWMELAGERVPTQCWFVETLADRGFRQGRDRRVGSNCDRRFILGLALKSGVGTVPP